MGVVSKEGDYRLIDSGPLPEAVAASAAIPWIFNPVNIPGKARLACAPDAFQSCDMRCRHVVSRARSLTKPAYHCRHLTAEQCSCITLRTARSPAAPRHGRA